jgi:hypothetical protein
MVRTLAVLLFLLPLLAFAKEETGRAAFETGRRLYFEGRYGEALPHLTEAYVASNKRPSTIRALAQCERALDHREEALRLFHEYLATTPRPKDASDIEAEIRELEALTLAPERTLPANPPREHEEEDFIWDGMRSDAPRVATVELEPPVAPVPEPSLTERPAFWLIIGGVLAAAGTAVALSFALSGDGDPYGGSRNKVLER